MCDTILFSDRTSGAFHIPHLVSLQDKHNGGNKWRKQKFTFERGVKFVIAAPGESCCPFAEKSLPFFNYSDFLLHGHGIRQKYSKQQKTLFTNKSMTFCTKEFAS